MVRVPRESGADRGSSARVGAALVEVRGASGRMGVGIEVVKSAMGRARRARA